MYYTKYRPQKFSEISKTSEAADALAKQVASHKTVHAYLFVGPRGIGKTTTARILAKALNCLHIGKNGDPCGKCNPCEEILKGTFSDLIEVDAASNRGIDDIRELREKVKLAPSHGKHKVYIIDEIHMLTTEAFNALLKTLEEPPAKTTFILCTTELHKVPDTIKSRCQVFKFKRATVSQLVEKLAKIVKEEGAKVDKQTLEKVAAASLGGFRDAETLLQQIIEGEISVDSICEFTSRETYFDFVSALVSKDSKKALFVISEVYKGGIDLYVWTGELLKYLRDLIFVKSQAEGLLDLPQSMFIEIKSQAEDVSIPWVLQCLEVFENAQQKVRQAFISQLPLEMAVVTMCGEVSDQVMDSYEDPRVPFFPNPIKYAKNVGKELKDTSKGVEVGSTNNGSSAPEAKTFVTLDMIKKSWDKFLSDVKSANNSIQVLLKSGKILDLEGRNIVLEVYYKFHKERIESTKNRKIIEEFLKVTYGESLGVMCKLCEEKPKNLKKGETGVLTDFNVAPADVIDTKAIIETFDGSLPL